MTQPPPVRMRRLAVAACLLSLTFAGHAMARIKLITLPVRERVEVHLDNPNATLVEEERIVPLVQGENQVDFSWAGTPIDPNSIVFRVLGPTADFPNLTANVLSVSYPPNENALVWQVSASAAGSVRVRISYLLGGLNRDFNYRAVASQNEQTLTLSQYVRINNLANETFDDANLFVGFGERFQKMLGRAETKEMLVNKFENVPIEKTYTASVVEFGYLNQPQDKLNVAMHYVLTNDKQHALGAEPLPVGKVRIFQKDNQGTTAFLGEDWAQLTQVSDNPQSGLNKLRRQNHAQWLIPLGAKMQLYLGVVQDIAVKRRVTDRQNERVAGDVYDRSVTLKYELENFKDTPVKVRLVELAGPLASGEGIGAPLPLNWKIIRQSQPQPGVTDLADLLATDPEDTNAGCMTFAVPVPAAVDGKPGKAAGVVTVVFTNTK